MAKAKAQKAAASRKGGGFMGGVLVMLALVGVSVLSPATALIIAVGAVPYLVTLIVARRTERALPTCVGTMSLVGIAAVLVPLWSTPYAASSFDTAMDLLADPVNSLCLIGSAAVGWAIFYAIPPFAAQTARQAIQARIRGLKAEQEKLVKTWGEDVAAEKPAASDTSKS